MRFGGQGASSSNAVGMAAIRAFLADYIPNMPEEKFGTNAHIRRRRLFLTAIVLCVSVFGAIAKWFYVAPHSSKVNGSAVMVGTPGSENRPLNQSAPGKGTATDPAKVGLQTPSESTGPKRIVPSQTLAALERVDQGSPNVMVWVNTASNVYHCPGARNYGNTIHGEYMTQSEAQRKANRPAYGKVCK
jgi:hypothetical protein